MATKTVVCPECGSAAAPGRYACTECGALLAAVALTPRGGAFTAAAEPEPPFDLEVADGVEGAAPDSGDAGEREPAAVLPTVIAGDMADDLPESAGPAGMADVPDAPDGPDPRHAPGGLAFDENAPLAAARSATAPDVLHDLADEAPTVDEAWPSARHETASAPEATPPPAVPSWPPPGDRGPIARAEQRTPAGSYLPPSAVLPPLDAGIVAGGTAGSQASAATSDRGAPASSWTERGSAVLSDALGSARITAAASRRAIAAGAGLAAVGILLPWVNTLAGASAFTNYLERWGLAGPGVWLVFVALLGLGGIAASSGRAASWPVGLPAVAAAAFLGGLVWPYLVGGFGRSIGVWVVLVGAIVLLVGGVLDRRVHHDDGDAIV